MVKEKYQNLRMLEEKKKNRLTWTCESIFAKMDFSDLVCNIYGCVASIPGGRKKKVVSGID